MLKTETMMAFSQVAKHRSFTAAANELNKTPMAMSKQISQLELLLEEPLFERSTRKIRLTEFGESLLARVHTILENHEALTEWLASRKGNFSGVLKVVAQDGQTFDETVFPWLAEFHALYPNIELIFDVQENILDVNTDPYDIYWGISDYLGINFPSLKQRSLWKARLGIYASPDYLKKFGTPDSPGDLSGHHMIGHPHASPDNALAVNKAAHSDQTDIEAIILEAPIKTVNRQSLMCVQGLGLINALEDNHDIKDYVAKKQLIPVLEPYWYSSAEIFIYYQQVKHEQPKVRAFIDFFLSKKSLW